MTGQLRWMNSGINLIAGIRPLAEEMDYLLSTSFRPYGDVMSFASRITTFAYWLNAEFHTRKRPLYQFVQ